MSSFEIKLADWTQDHAELVSGRTEVFVIEQKVPVSLELDEYDEVALHVKALNSDQQVIATARMLPNHYIGRMCVLKPYRGLGDGRELLRFCIAYARDQGIPALHLNAQTSALAFYGRLGFEPDSDEFMEAGIPHRHMTLIME